MNGSRGAGRTKELVNNLPEVGAVIIVHTFALVPYVRAMIGNLRGPSILNRCKVIALTTVGGAHTLLGESRLVVADHAFWTQADPSVVSWVMDFMAVQESRRAA